MYVVKVKRHPKKIILKHDYSQASIKLTMARLTCWCQARMMFITVTRLVTMATTETTGRGMTPELILWVFEFWAALPPAENMSLMTRNTYCSNIFSRIWSATMDEKRKQIAKLGICMTSHCHLLFQTLCKLIWICTHSNTRYHQVLWNHQRS